jgi:ABC-2 type transport system permease protein
MTFADKQYLRLISLLYPLLEKSGVDTQKLHEILKVKLLIDDRRPRGFQKKNADAKPSKISQSWGVQILTLVMGAFIGSVLFIFRFPMVGQTVYFSMFMVLLALTIITDFTTVLIDTRDQFIILPRPVNDRTMAVSRILHISIYVFKQALMLALPGIIMIGFIDGIAAVPLFFIQVVLITLLSILLVNMVYLLLLKSVSPQKFKDIISYFQIGFSIVIFGTYYLLPRMVDITILQKIDLLKNTWAYFLPPVWIAALNEVLIHPARATLITSIMAIVGITAPLAGIWLVAKVLAPGFNKMLSAVSTSDGNTTGKPALPGSKPRFSLGNRIANLVARDPIENAGFRITWKLAARIREFKIKVYPAFAYVPIYFLYFALNTKGHSLTEKYMDLKGGSKYILLIYLSTFVINAVLQHISYSEKYKAAWVYYALPITQPGKILSGMYKAVITLYYMPYCIVIGAVSIAIWGPGIINDLILAMLIGMIYGMLTALFMLKGLPFSRPVLNKQSGGRIITSLLITSVIGGVGFVHYILLRWEWVIWGLIVISAAIYWIMLYYFKRQSWENIEMEEA